VKAGHRLEKQQQQQPQIPQISQIQRQQQIYVFYKTALSVVLICGICGCCCCRFGVRGTVFRRVGEPDAKAADRVQPLAVQGLEFGQQRLARGEPVEDGVVFGPAPPARSARTP